MNLGEIDNFSLTNKTKRNVPDIPFVSIKNKILGPSYGISLVFIGPRKAKDLNKKYRHKDYFPNVLTFPLEKKTGEIFINLSQAKKESASYQQSPDLHIAFLFIHGLLHLKGMSHGSKMEGEEKKFLETFFRDDQKLHHRFGYRNELDSSRRLRTKKRR